MNKKILILITILIIITCIVVGGFFTFKTIAEDDKIDGLAITTTTSQKKLDQTPITNTSSVKIYYSDEDKWNTYKDEHYRFSFKYPEDWGPVKDETLDYIFFAYGVSIF